MTVEWWQWMAAWILMDIPIALVVGRWLRGTRP